MADETPEIPDLLKKVTNLFAETLEWLVTTFEDPVITSAIREDLALGTGAAPPPPVSDERLAGIRAFTDKTDPDAESFAQVVDDVVAVTAALGGWIDAIKSDDTETGEVLYLLLTLGATERLRIRAPLLWGLTQTAAVVHDVFGAAPGADESALGGILQPLFDLLELLAPVRTFGLPERGLDETRATRISDLASVALILAAEKTEMGRFVEARYGWDHPVPESTTPLADALSQRVLTLSFGDMDDPDGARAHLTAVLVTEEHGGAGMVLAPGGTLVLEHVVPRPQKTPLPAGAEIPALAYRAEVVAAGGLSLFFNFGSDTAADAEVGTGVQAALSLGVKPVLMQPSTDPDEPPTTRPAPRTVPAFRMGFVGKSRIEIGSFEGGFEFGADRARAEIVMRDIDLVTQLGDGDNFLSTQGDRKALFGFDLVIVADTGTGISFGGGSGLHVAIPVSRSVFGFFVMHYIEVEVLPSVERDVGLLVAGAFALRLGPFTAMVEGIGFVLDIGFEAGNLGILDVGIGFKAPNGIGLALDLASVKGGGFLFFDQPKGEYAGVLELKWGPITFKAIGILTTKLPDGAPGYSLLIVLFGEFSPTPIGFGFFLTGLGGMIGIQHGVSGDALRDGLRTGVLDDMLFPKDPVANAPRILNQMRAVFPITPRAMTFGPFVRIEYSKPAIVTIQLGLIFQLDNVFQADDRDVELTRMVLVGQILVEMPPPKDRPKGTPVLLKLLVDIVGDLDFQSESLAIDARLRDSKVSGMTLTGSLVVRVRWGEEQSWIAAAGGFHPEFKDLPAGLPKQERLGLSLRKGIATVKFEMYVAVTSNTFQIGARIFAQAKKWGFSVEGWLGFDALFEFDPFRFKVAIEAGVALKRGSSTLMGIDLKLSIAGPGLWRMTGSAKFKLLFLSKTIKFDEEWGDDPAVSVITLDAEAEVRRALSEPGNWAAALPTGGEMLVSLRSSSPEGAIPDDQVPAHPLGRLTGMQKVIPFELEVDRIGGARPAGARKVSVTGVTLGGDGVARSYVDEHFARAQFLDMSEDEKLSTESFERFPAGVSVAGDAVTVPGHVSASLDFETIYLPTGDTEPVETLPIAVLVAQARLGAAAQSQLRDHRFLAGAPVTPVSVVAPPAVAVSAATFDVIDSGLDSVATARLLRSRPVAEPIQIVESWELEEVGVP
jgi:hypothetical protein